MSEKEAGDGDEGKKLIDLGEGVRKGQDVVSAKIPEPLPADTPLDELLNSPPPADSTPSKTESSSDGS